MHDSMYELKRMLCKELDDLVSKGELSAGDLDVVDKLTHSIKSLVTILAMDEGEYSYSGYNYSGAQRRDNMGRYADSRDGYSGRYEDGYSGRRYSRDEGKTHMIRQFENLIGNASSQEEREVIQSALNRLRNM